MHLFLNIDRMARFKFICSQRSAFLSPFRMSTVGETLFHLPQVRAGTGKVVDCLNGNGHFSFFRLIFRECESKKSHKLVAYGDYT